MERETVYRVGKSTMMVSLSTGWDAGKDDRQRPCQSQMGRPSRRVSRVAGCWRAVRVPPNDAEYVDNGLAMVLPKRQEQEEAREEWVKQD